MRAASPAAATPFESTLERDFVTLLEFDKTVDYDEQPVRIRFMGRDGRRHPHVPDFLVFFWAQARVPGKQPCLYQVKYDSDLRAGWPGLKPALLAASRYAKLQDWDSAIVTDRHIRTTYLNNARFLLPYTYYPPNPGDEQVLMASVSELREATAQSLLASIFRSDRVNQAQLIPTLWNLVGRRLIGVDLDQPLAIGESLVAAATLTIAPGGDVEVAGRRYVVAAFIDADCVLAQDPLTGESQRLFVRDIRPVSPEVVKSDSIELTLVDDADWHEAQRRFSIIQPLLAGSRERRADVAAAAKAAGADCGNSIIVGSPTTSPTEKCQRSSPASPMVDVEKAGRLMMSRPSSRQPSRISTSKISNAQFRRHPTKCCGVVVTQGSSRRRTRRRSAAYCNGRRRTRLRRRGNRKRADDRFNARTGQFTPEWPLHTVAKIDHTKLGIEYVDESNRRIGRPWLTLAIDVYSRVVAGFIFP